MMIKSSPSPELRASHAELDNTVAEAWIPNGDAPSLGGEIPCEIRLPEV